MGKIPEKLMRVGMNIFGAFTYFDITGIVYVFSRPVCFKITETFDFLFDCITYHVKKPFYVFTNYNIFLKSF